MLRLVGPLTSMMQLAIFPTAVREPGPTTVYTWIVHPSTWHLNVVKTTLSHVIMQGGQRMRSIRQAVVFIALGSMLFGLASVGIAGQQPKAQPRQPEITGRFGAPEMILQGPVVSVNPSAGFIVIRRGAGRQAEEIPLEVDAKTTLARAGKKANIGEVKQGDRVKVRYSGRPGDVAKMIEVTPGKGMPAGRPAAKKPMPARG
jgi:hypothetical protein